MTKPKWSGPHTMTSAEAAAQAQAALDRLSSNVGLLDRTVDAMLEGLTSAETAILKQRFRGEPLERIQAAEARVKQKFGRFMTDGKTSEGPFGIGQATERMKLGGRVRRLTWEEGRWLFLEDGPDGKPQLTMRVPEPFAAPRGGCHPESAVLRHPKQLSREDVFADDWYALPYAKNLPVSLQRRPKDR